MYEFIPPIMQAASRIMLTAHDIASAVSVKPGDANFVTAYDVAVQDYLYRELGKALPDAVFIGEEAEENHTELLASNLALILDPIDGTTNFIHDYRASAISAAVCDHGTVVYGAVYDPYTDRLYHAEQGKGAFVLCGGKESPISVSDRALADGLCGFGSCPYYKDELGEKTFRAAYAMYRHARDIRRCGSAALDLAMIAFGTLDVFFEYRLSPWDYAACSRIVEEAGGVITQFDGSPVTLDRPCSIFAGNPKAYAEAAALGVLKD